MRFFQQPSTNPVAERAARLVQAFKASGEPEVPGKSNHLAKVIADHLGGLTGGHRNTWRPAHDPEPEPEITTHVHDGVRRYQRVTSGWRATDGDQPVYQWPDIPAPLVADAPDPDRRRWKINNPTADAPLADWYTTHPDEVRAMLHSALSLMESRRGAGIADVRVSGTMWTPAGGLPVIFVYFEEPPSEPGRVLQLEPAVFCADCGGQIENPDTDPDVTATENGGRLCPNCTTLREQQ